MDMSQATFALELSQVVNRVFLVRSQHGGTVRAESVCGKAERSGLSRSCLGRVLPATAEPGTERRSTRFLGAITPTRKEREFAEFTRLLSSVNSLRFPIATGSPS